MLTFTRRRSLGTALALLFSTAVPVAHADPANVPVIWDGKKMFESFQNEATGISSKGPAGRPKAYVAFDTQCRDCWHLHRKLEPFLDKIGDEIYNEIKQLTIDLPFHKRKRGCRLGYFFHIQCNQRNWFVS